MRLNPLFQEGAVLQHGKTLPVWGETRPDVIVRGELAGIEIFSRSSGRGEFTLYFPPLPPGGPFELRVGVEGDPAEETTVRDVLLGDVWLASGQSNMEYPLNADTAWWPGNASGPDSTARRQEKKLKELLADTDNFRFFKVERCASGAQEREAAGVWRRMTPENAGDCSAVAAWFGHVLRRKTGIPVGLIVSSWGGTIAEAWTSCNGLTASPVTARLAADLAACHRKREFCTVREKIDVLASDAVQPDPGNAGFGQGWAAPGFDDSGWKAMAVPGSWIQQDIAGNGAVWIRRSVELPEDWVGQDLILRTGGIDKHDVAYVNGREVGRTGKGLECDHWCSERRYPVPGASGGFEVRHRGHPRVFVHLRRRFLGRFQAHPRLGRFGVVHLGHVEGRARVRPGPDQCPQRQQHFRFRQSQHAGDPFRRHDPSPRSLRPAGRDLVSGREQHRQQPGIR